MHVGALPACDAAAGVFSKQDVLLCVSGLILSLKVYNQAWIPLRLATYVAGFLGQKLHFLSQKCIAPIFDSADADRHASAKA